VNPWKVILATMVIFGTGVLTGALIIRYTTDMARPQRQGFGSRFAEGSPGGMRLEFLRRTQRDLDLTEDQRERIDKVLKQSQERTRKLMEPVSPQLRQEVQRAKAEFREVLTPEQQARFDELLKMQQQRFKEQHHPSGRQDTSVTNAPATNAI
jgi:Spy/CpxP family protein refolding chaperone